MVQGIGDALQDAFGFLGVLVALGGVGTIVGGITIIVKGGILTILGGSLITLLGAGLLVGGSIVGWACFVAD